MLLTELIGVTIKVEEKMPGFLELPVRTTQVLTKMLNSWEKVEPSVRYSALTRISLTCHKPIWVITGNLADSQMLKVQASKLDD